MRNSGRKDRERSLREETTSSVCGSGSLATEMCSVREWAGSLEVTLVTDNQKFPVMASSSTANSTGGTRDGHFRWQHVEEGPCLPPRERPD